MHTGEPKTTATYGSPRPPVALLLPKLEGSDRAVTRRLSLYAIPVAMAVVILLTLGSCGLRIWQAM